MLNDVHAKEHFKLEVWQKCIHKITWSGEENNVNAPTHWWSRCYCGQSQIYVFIQRGDHMIFTYQLSSFINTTSSVDACLCDVFWLRFCSSAGPVCVPPPQLLSLCGGRRSLGLSLHATLLTSSAAPSRQSLPFSSAVNNSSRMMDQTACHVPVVHL